MSIDKIIATIPTRDERERREMRANAQRLLENGTEAKKADACRLLDARARHEDQARERQLARVRGWIGRTSSLKPSRLDP